MATTRIELAHRRPGVGPALMQRVMQRVMDTRDPDRAQAEVTSRYCEHRLDVAGTRGDFRAVQTEAALGGLALHRLRYGAEVAVHPVPLGEWVLVSSPVRAAMTITSGREQRTVGVGESVVIDPEREFALRWEAGCELRTVRLSRRVVEAAAGDAGLRTRSGLRFALAGPSRAADQDSWSALVSYAEREATLGGAVSTSTLLADQLTRLLAGSLVRSHRLLDADPAAAATAALPRHVRRAVQHLEEHADRDVSVGELAGVVEVSVRSLQEGFRRSLGTTPSLFLRDLRLDRARAELTRADPAVHTVADVAHRCGFGHLGRFAHHYRDRFGELPSQTLSR